MKCFACAFADQDPKCGHFHSSCQECTARALALSPKFFEANQSQVLTGSYREALRAAFDGVSIKDAHERVMAWAAKIDAARNRVSAP